MGDGTRPCCKSVPLPSASVRILVVAVVGMAALSQAGCNSAPAPAFDLTAPRLAGRPGGTPTRGQIAVAEPTAVQVLDGDQIIVKDAAGSVSYVSGGRWADRLPSLVQARLIQTFENGPRLYGVSRPGGRIVADYQLNTDLRAFQINSTTREAVVEVSAKLVNDRSGRIVTTRLFVGRAPVGVIDGPGAADALDRALSRVMVDVVRWVNAGRAVASS